MGLGLSLIGISRHKTGANAIDARQLAEAFLGIAAEQPIVGRLASDGQQISGAHGVLVIPLEEEVVFSEHSDGLNISAKTSTLGPGYHAYVCMLLDKLADEMGFSWIETEEAIDETGYFTGRDFQSLQSQMARQLLAISERLVEIGKDPSVSMMKIGFPVNFAPIWLEGFALTVRGPRDRGFFEKISTSDDIALLRAAEEHYPWWAEGIDQQSALGLAEALLWMEYPWRSELNEREQTIADAVLAMADVSGGLQEMDQLDVEELNALLNSDIPIGPVQSSGVGYLRGLMERPLAGPWTITLPGFFHETFDPDDGTMTHWFGDRAIHTTTFAFERPAGFKAEDVLPSNQPDIAFVENDVAYFAFKKQSRDNGTDVYEISGTIEAEDGAAVMTILYENPSDEDWANEVFRSVKSQKA